MGERIQGEKEVLAAIEGYMLKVNRPYNATSLHLNLRQAIAKPQIVKALSTLTAKEVLVEKEYGKQKIYVANQAKMPVPDPDEMQQLKVKTGTAKAELDQLDQKCTDASRELARLNAEPRDPELESRVTELTAEVAAQDERLEKLRAGAEQISEADKKKIEADYDANVKQWKKRKRIANDVLGQILENYPKKKKDLYEAVGIETDEMVGADVTTF